MLRHCQREGSREAESSDSAPPGILRMVAADLRGFKVQLGPRIAQG